MIILIDDDDATRDALRLLLECEGLLPVRDFASCEAFLAAEELAHPDCVILDIHMPGMTGLELLERLRARGANIPAILMTGDPTPRIPAPRLRTCWLYSKNPSKEANSSLSCKARSTGVRSGPASPSTLCDQNVLANGRKDPWVSVRQ